MRLALRKIGTQKRWVHFYPNPINFESEYQGANDKLNRLRHYFWVVDNRGRLWRRELNPKAPLQGEMRQPDFKDKFFQKLHINNMKDVYPDFPYLSIRGKELNFVTCGHSPIVFHDLTPEGDLVYANSLKIRFDPEAVVVDESGPIYHRVILEGPKPVAILGLIERSVAFNISQHIQPDEDSSNGGFILTWNGARHRIQKLESKSDKEPESSPFHVQNKTKWWSGEDQ